MNLQDFLHGIRARLFFGLRVCREYLRIYVQKFRKQIEYLDSLGKHTQIQKNNWPNQISDKGDIIDLKSRGGFKVLSFGLQVKFEYEIHTSGSADGILRFVARV